MKTKHAKKKRGSSTISEEKQIKNENNDGNCKGVTGKKAKQRKTEKNKNISPNKKQREKENWTFLTI